MKAETKSQIEEIIGGMTCPRGFRCMERNFEQLCNAEDYGNERYIKCLEQEPSRCLFSVPFGVGGYCKCPLRVYLCKELQR